MIAEPTAADLNLVRGMRAKARSGWYIGTMETLERYGAHVVTRARTTPELLVSLTLSRDRMHHSVGWWRNAEYEYCWHLSFGAYTEKAQRNAEARATLLNRRVPPVYEEMPADEVRYWAALVFGEHTDKLWQEPGGTDPRLTAGEKRIHARLWHLRLFLDPQLLDLRGEPHVPFIPRGEVYDLTRWIPGLTPEKVDR